jgi:hypothetical protein
MPRRVECVALYGAGQFQAGPRSRRQPPAAHPGRRSRTSAFAPLISRPEQIHQRFDIPHSRAGAGGQTLASPSFLGRSKYTNASTHLIPGPERTGPRVDSLHSRAGFTPRRPPGSPMPGPECFGNEMRVGHSAEGGACVAWCVASGRGRNFRKIETGVGISGSAGGGVSSCDVSGLEIPGVGSARRKNPAEFGGLSEPTPIPTMPRYHLPGSR